MKTQTKLNLRFLTCVLAICAALGVGVHLVHGYQVKRNASSYLRLADKAKEDAEKAKKDADDARDENKPEEEKKFRAKEKEYLAKELEHLVRYIGFVPKDIDALARYGEALDDMAKLTESPRARMQAYLRLEGVLRQDPDREKIRQRQVDTAIYFGKYKEALDHLDLLQKLHSHDAKLMRLEGFCHVGNGNFKKAKEAYQKGVLEAPHQIDNYLSLAVLNREHPDSTGDKATADKLMGELIDNNKSNFRAYLMRARYYLQFDGNDPKKINQAKDDVEEAYKLAADEPEVVLAKAEVRRAEGLQDANSSANAAEDSRKMLRKGLEKNPRDARLYFALITLEVRDENIKDALKLTRQGLKEFKDLPDDDKGKSDLLHALADLLVQTGELKEADEVIARLTKIPKFQNQKHLLDYLRARILVRKGKWSEASELLDGVRTKLSRQPGLQVQTELLLGQCHDRLGNPDQALLAYQRALKLDHLSVAVRYRNGSALLALGRLDEALAEFRTILTAPNKPAGLHLVMARALVALNWRLPPDNRKRNLGEIDRELAAATEEKANPAEVAVLKAETFLLNDDKEAARRVLEDARKEHPDQVAVWLELARLLRRDEALPLLEKARKQPELAQSVELRLYQLLYLLQAPAEAKTPEESKKILENLRATLAEMEKEATNLNEEANRMRMLNGLAEAHLRLGDRADAERLWTQVAEKQPNNLVVRMALFDLAMAKKSSEAMDRMLKEMRDLEGENGVYWRYATASRLIEDARPAQPGELPDANRRQLRRARQYLLEAASRRPSWPRIATLEATLDELEGNVDAAIEKYQQALDRGEKRPVVVRRLVELLGRQGRGGEAMKMVRKLGDQENMLLSAGLGRLAAEQMLTDTKDPNRALKLALESVPPKSTNYQDFLWLGRLHWQASEMEEKEKERWRQEAEKAFRRACELDEKDPETWVTLVSFYAAIAQDKAEDKAKQAIAQKKAEQAIAQATKKLPANLAPRALAGCYESIGEVKKAEENYLAAVKATPEDKRPLRLIATFYIRHNLSSQAEKHLRALLAMEINQADDDVVWARRALAAVLASTARKSKIDEALTLVNTNLEKNRSSQPDLHTKALLLAASPSTHKDAIRLLEELASSNPLPASELFTLAQLYMAENDWESARTKMLLLLSRPEGKNPTYEAFFARSLLQHDNIPEAEAQLAQLEKAWPDDPITREIKARVFKAKGQHEEAVAVVREYAKYKDADLVRLAMFLESLGLDSKDLRILRIYLDEADEMYRKYAKNSDKPERFLPLALSLGRQHKIADALAYCEEAQKNKADLPTVAQTMINILRAGAAGNEDCLRVEKSLKEMLAQTPESVQLMIFLADLYDYQEHFAEAERLYRQALQKEPNNVIVLNNLAWLLAFKGSAAREEALAAINKAIDLVRDGPELLDTRGVIYLKMSRPDKALQDLQEVVAQSPSANHLFHLAFAQYTADHKRDAGTVWKDAKNRGLDKKRLHPLEKPLYDKVEAELDQWVK
jgi:tetratricopeptide (TPR) repeat protein